jgi:hypothetical protein
MTASSKSIKLVLFRGGFVADWEVVRRLLDVESRGCTFSLEADGRFAIRPPSVLTADDINFFRAHQREARQVIGYNADTCELAQ